MAQSLYIVDSAVSELAVGLLAAISVSCLARESGSRSAEYLKNHTVIRNPTTIGPQLEVDHHPPATFKMLHAPKGSWFSSGPFGWYARRLCLAIELLASVATVDSFDAFQLYPVQITRLASLFVVTLCMSVMSMWILFHNQSLHLDCPWWLSTTLGTIPMVFGLVSIVDQSTTLALPVSLVALVAIPSLLLYGVCLQTSANRWAAQCRRYDTAVQFQSRSGEFGQSPTTLTRLSTAPSTDQRRASGTRFGFVELPTDRHLVAPTVTPAATPLSTAQPVPLTSASTSPLSPATLPRASITSALNPITARASASSVGGTLNAQAVNGLGLSAPVSQSASAVMTLIQGGMIRLKLLFMSYIGSSLLTSILYVIALQTLANSLTIRLVTVVIFKCIVFLFLLTVIWITCPPLIQQPFVPLPPPPPLAIVAMTTLPNPPLVILRSAGPVARRSAPPIESKIGRDLSVVAERGESKLGQLPTVRDRDRDPNVAQVVTKLDGSAPLPLATNGPTGLAPLSPVEPVQLVPAIAKGQTGVGVLSPVIAKGQSGVDPLSPVIAKGQSGVDPLSPVIAKGQTGVRVLSPVIAKGQSGVDPLSPVITNGQSGVDPISPVVSMPVPASPDQLSKNRVFSRGQTSIKGHCRADSSSVNPVRSDSDVKDSSGSHLSFPEVNVPAIHPPIFVPRLVLETVERSQS